MLGPDLIIAPVLAPGLTARAVYLPKGRWYRWNAASVLSAVPRSGAKSKDAHLAKHPSTSALRASAQDAYDGPAHIAADAPLDELPIFVRAGAVIPMWPLAQHTGAIDRADVTLHIWSGDGRFDLYEDDGVSRSYLRGEYWVTAVRVRTKGDTVTVTFNRLKGRPLKFQLHSMAKARVTLDGSPLAARRNIIGITGDGKPHTLIITKV